MAIGAAVVGGLFQASAANKASKAQQSAAMADIAFQTETRDLIRADLDPYRQSGTAANNALMYELGLGAMPEGYQGFQKTPGYDFRLGEGVNALQAGAAAKGGLYSGAAMKALTQYGQDYGSNEYGNYFARLGQQQNIGLSAAGMNSTAAQNTAAGVSNAYGNMGNAQAAGYIGSANAFSSGLGNAVGAWNYQKQYGGGNQINIGQSGSLFGGSSWS